LSTSHREAAMSDDHTGKGILHLPPGKGRRYELGRMTAVFKADEDETAARYSASECWLEPGADGPGAHAHGGNGGTCDVRAGTVSSLGGEDWLEAPHGTFRGIPAGVAHDFRNRTAERVGLLNVFIPGGFGRDMPAIVDWF